MPSFWWNWRYLVRTDLNTAMRPRRKSMDLEAKGYRTDLFAIELAQGAQSAGRLMLSSLRSDCLAEKKQKLWQRCLRLQKRPHSGSGKWEARSLPKPLHESRIKPSIHRNDWANSLAEKCGVVGKYGPAGSQITSDYHPNGVDCRYKENLGPSLHILSTRREEATESFHGRRR